MSADAVDVRGGSALSGDNVAPRSQFGAVIALAVFPLIVIAVQLWQKLPYPTYKLFLLLPPIVYCWLRGIPIHNEVLKFRNWRQGLGPAIALGALSVVVFWTVWWFFADALVDRKLIIDHIDHQFGMNAKAFIMIAPFTCLINSLNEEFFFRSFAFGQLRKHNRAVAYLLPAAVFVFQHVLFFYLWLGLGATAIACAGLGVFAIVLQWQYERYDTVVAPWVTHIFGDIAMMGVAADLLYRISG